MIARCPMRQCALVAGHALPHRGSYGVPLRTVSGRCECCGAAEYHGGVCAYCAETCTGGQGHTVCTDCGATSPVPCPWNATDCSACSAARERLYPRADLTVCPAHGAYLPAED